MATSNAPVAAKRARKPIKKGGIPLSAGMVLVTLGVVYGDIGTSPMYTLKAIMSGNGGLATMSEDVVLGALSLLIWTITLITTVKYVLVAMKADNHNEGGIACAPSTSSTASSGTTRQSWLQSPWSFSASSLPCRRRARRPSARRLARS